MSAVFRAVDEPVTSRLDYWRHVIRTHLVPMDVSFRDGPDLRDQLVTGQLGPLRVVEWTTGPGAARRTTRHIRRSDSDELYQIFVHGGGRVVGEQDEQRNELAPGDIGLVDPARPLRCFHTAHRGVLVAFPRTLLPLRGREVGRLLGTRIPGDTGPGALASTLLRQLPRHLGDESQRVRTQLGGAVLDLLAVALSARLDRSAPVDARRQALTLHIERFIDERLGDPALTPAMIAAAHHISLRQLHKLFEEQGVAGLIRRRRLERCRRDLLDPTLATRPVAATAARWGFGNAAHFGRLFRETYGLPPGDFRRTRGAVSSRRS